MSLLRWYKFEGNSVDSMTGQNSYITGVTSVQGKIGQCYSFNATDSYIGITGLRNTLDSFTIAMWVYYRDFTYPKTFMAINCSSPAAYTTGGKGFDFGHGYKTDGVDFAIGDGTNKIRTTLTFDVGSRPPDLLNKWVHITFVVDRVSKMAYAFVNGVRQSSSVDISSITGSIFADTDMVIGTLYGWQTDANIDDIRIYDNVLSDKEIYELSKAKVLHYKFDDFQEPTTNLVTTPFDFVTGYSRTVTATNGTLLNFTGENNAGTLSNAGYYAQTGISLSTGKRYTTSWYLKAGTQNSVGINWGGAHNGTRTTFDIDLNTGTVSNLSLASGENYGVERVSNGFWKIWYSSLLTGANYYPQISIASGDIIIGGMQIEEKDHATPFVNGSRLGYISDCSGYKNDGVLNASSPQWITNNKIGNGCYKFNSKSFIDGTFNYSLGVWTLSAWINDDGTQTDYRSIIQTRRAGDDALYIYPSANNNILSYWPAHGGNINIVPNMWHHVAATRDESGTIKYYINGQAAGSSITTVNNIDKIQIGGYGSTDSECFSGFIDDVRVYATALSTNDVKELCQQRASLDNEGNLYAHSFKEYAYRKSIIDYSTWVLDSYGGQTGFYRNGEVDANKIILYNAPNNTRDIVWASPGNDAVSDADGGFETVQFDIDPTKKYRFSVWIRRENVGSGSGATYFGVNGYDSSGANNGVLNLSNGVANMNPYFGSNYYEAWPKIVNNWLLFVAHVHPYTYSLTSSDPISGVYETNGVKQHNLIDFKWQSTNAHSNLRSYLYYSTKTDERQYWYRPRVDLCDGNEPTITELINCTENPNLYSNINCNENGIFVAKTFNEVGPVNGIVGWWKLDGDARDYSGNNNHGTVNGATLDIGLKNKSYKFDGSDDYIRLSFDVTTGNNNWTCSAWIKTSSIGRNTILSNWSGGPVYNDLNTYNGKICYRHYNNAWIDEFGTSNIADGNWHHLAWVNRSDKTMDMYVDGIKEATVSSTLSSGSGPVNNIGRNWSNTSIACINDVRVFNITLAPEEVVTLYKLGSSQTRMQQNIDGTLYISGGFKEI